jgi:hypothetical protein
MAIAGAIAFVYKNVSILGPPVPPGPDRFEKRGHRPYELQDAVTGGIVASFHLQLVRAENRRTPPSGRQTPVPRV